MQVQLQPQQLVLLDNLAQCTRDAVHGSHVRLTCRFGLQPQQLVLLDNLAQCTRATLYMAYIMSQHAGPVAAAAVGPAGQSGAVHSCNAGLQSANAPHGLHHGVSHAGSIAAAAVGPAGQSGAVHTRCQPAVCKCCTWLTF